MSSQAAPNLFETAAERCAAQNRATVATAFTTTGRISRKATRASPSGRAIENPTSTAMTRMQQHKTTSIFWDIGVFIRSIYNL
jgi:hypothetical protein